MSQHYLTGYFTRYYEPALPYRVLYPVLCTSTALPGTMRQHCLAQCCEYRHVQPARDIVMAYVVMAYVVMALPSRVR